MDLGLEQENKGTIRLSSGEVARVVVRKGAADMVKTTYHPEFGLSIPNTCMQVTFEGPECAVEFSWG